MDGEIAITVIATGFPLGQQGGSPESDSSVAPATSNAEAVKAASREADLKPLSPSPPPAPKVIPTRPVSFRHRFICC